MRDAASWTRLRRRRVSRRALLRASGRAGVGAAALALVGCGGDDDDDPGDSELVVEAPDIDTPAQSENNQPSVVEDDTPEPPAAPSEPVVGGIAHFFAATEETAHDRWDPHRSRFSQTQMFHSLMYNRLIRFDSVSAGTLEADLTGLPETPDEETYIFTVRDGARFWDREPTNGRAFTAEDIRFNIQRQIDGRDSDDEPDLLFFRQDAYRRTASMDVTETNTITLKTEGPDATYLTSVHAGPWGWMTSAEAVEEYGERWRDDRTNIDLNSGTGPYVPVAFTSGGDLTLRRSDNWWKASGAYLDGILLRRTANAGIATAYRSGQIDRVDFPVDREEIELLREDFPESTTYEFPIDLPIQLTHIISRDRENPLSDPRVGLALGMAIDRFEMIDRLYGGDGRPSGPLPWFLDGWAIPEDELLTRPGYRPNKEDDLSDIQDLLAAAGGADTIATVSIVVPDLFEGFFPGISDTLTTMLERNSGLTIRTSFQSYAEITAQLREGTLPAFFGWGAASRQADPTDQWAASAHSDGDENHGRYSDTEVDGLIDEMRVTLNEGERKALARQVQDRLLETGFWVQNVTNGIQLGIARSYVHIDPRAFDFAWAAHHLEGTWIDTEQADYPSDRALPDDEADADTVSPSDESDDLLPPTIPIDDE